ncbi:UNVERIFIED_ORG: hypothetical protein ABIB52_004656 [Arthrobacter sp. UYCu721]
MSVNLRHAARPRASRGGAITGSSRSLSLAYSRGELVRVRTGVYHHWQSDVVGTRGFGVTSLVQMVVDCVVRLELPETVAIVDAALGSRRKEGEGLTRVDVQQAAAGLASAAIRRRVLEVLELADEAAESVGSPGAGHSSTFWGSGLRSCSTPFMTMKASLRGPTCSGPIAASLGSSTATPSMSATNSWATAARGRPFWRRKSARIGCGRSATPLSAGTGKR